MGSQNPGCPGWSGQAQRNLPDQPQNQEGEVMTAVWRSKWLDWQPGDENISVSPEPELTKLTKTNSVSFVSATSGTSQIISAPEHDLAAEEFDPLDDLRLFFTRWSDPQVWQDAKGIPSRKTDPGWSTTVTALHRD